MTGSLTVKNGTFYIVLNYTENGKRKRPWISTGLPVKGNKRKAEQMLQETLQKYRQAKCPKADIRFSDYIRRWLTIVQRKVDEVTYQGYEILADTQILPYFDTSGVQLQDVTTEVLHKPTWMKNVRMAVRTAKADSLPGPFDCIKISSIRRWRKQ